MARLQTIIIDGIGPVLDFMVATTAMRIAEAMDDGKYEIETYARYNAPWADRSGMARSGLTASVDMEAGVVVLELAHTVDYGIWLELIQDGRFAIIMPTLEALGPEILARAGSVVVNTDGAF